MMTSKTVGVYVIFGYVARLVSFYDVIGVFAEILSHWLNDLQLHWCCGATDADLRM